MLRLGSLVLLAVLAGAARPAAACTTFLLEREKEIVVGKSYDWSLAHGLVMVNRRGVAKQALTLSQGERPARWLAKYGSLTFNQYGRELPNGGMNEAGLVVEVMWLDSSVTPPADDRATVSELQLIQYLLDTAATTAEAVCQAQAVRVSRVYARVHYLACDRTGACAALEHVGGRLVVSSGAGLPVRALTNDTYADSRAFLARHAGFGGAQPLPAGRGSLERFARAAAAVSRPVPDRDLVGAAFGVLDRVRMGDYTKWQIVYEPRRLRVHFRTRDRATIKTVELRPLLAACPRPVPILELDTPAAGDATKRFRDYTTAANQSIVERGLATLKGKVPPGALEQLARYPEMLPCPK
ncbi:MAG TPA: linear amide C-N hydrolase [Polyangia bacterium]|jgi:choloylglycine hydrolase